MRILNYILLIYTDIRIRYITLNIIFIFIYYVEKIVYFNNNYINVKIYLFYYIIFYYILYIYIYIYISSTDFTDLIDFKICLPLNLRTLFYKFVFIKTCIH